jgi:phosphomethylpyrimidine synthase
MFAGIPFSVRWPARDPIRAATLYLKLVHNTGIGKYFSGFSGHVPLNEIVAYIQFKRNICQGSPFYMLGQMVIDLAPVMSISHTSTTTGLLADHLRSRLPLLCHSSRAPMPSDQDNMQEGIIAAYAADAAKGILDAID